MRGFIGRIGLIAFFAVPGLVVAYFLHSAVWLLTVPVGQVILICIIAALSPKRNLTPQQLADALEAHLLGTEGPWDWDDTTSVTLADVRLESLRSRLIPDYDSLDTPEKQEQFRQIIETLRRGEIPEN